jgi:hypothetical protein
MTFTDDNEWPLSMQPVDSQFGLNPKQYTVGYLCTKTYVEILKYHNERFRI